MKKDLLRLLDLSTEEILRLLSLADRLKDEQKRHIPHPHLSGKTLAMIFTKSSTRTRVSFEVGMTQLGGHAVFLSPADAQFGRGEPICDTARVLARYCDGIMIRTFAQSDVEELARYAPVPVINALTDDFHPCQVLADLMTIREHKSTLEGLKLCFLGDGFNMANSLIVGGLKTGMRVSVAIPEGYNNLHRDVVSYAASCGNRFCLTDRPMEAAADADVVVTDVWSSMGQEAENEARAKAFDGFQVNAALMRAAAPGALVLHCLPAHRGEEITDEIMEAHGEIFDEAENRLHAQKAVLVTLMGRQG